MAKYDVNGNPIPEITDKQANYPTAAQLEQQQKDALARDAYRNQVQMQAANQPAQPAPVQQPNLFAQQKQAYLASPQAQGKAEISTRANAGSAVTTKPNERMVAVDAFGNPAGFVHGTKAVGVKPIDPSSSTDGLDSVLGHFTSPEEEEKYRKASVARQRIMAVGDALRHIGNIYHTTRYAPSQKFNMPEEAERQRYLQEKSLRDQANQRIISYQQAKAAIDQKARQWEADYGLKVADAARKAGATEAQIKNMQDKLAEQHRMNDLTHGLNKDRLAWQIERGDRQDKENARHHKVTEGQNAQRINLQKQKLEWQKSNGGNGSNVPPLDTPNGKIQPSGRNYGNQLLQMWDYAKESGLVSESDVQKALRDAGFGNETPDNVKRQQVLSLLRTNKLLGDYAVNRLGWSSGGMSGGMNLGLDEDDEMDLGLD